MHKLCGIYTITNTVNGKVYVGSSIDIKTRWYGHRDKLKRGTHGNRFLLHSWNKYGQQSFEFRVVELCVPEELVDREQSWAFTLNTFDQKDGFNIANIVAPRRLGKKHSPESIAKMRIAQSKRGKPAPFSEETKRKMSVAQKARYASGKSPNLGRVFSEEWKKKISESRKGIGKGRVVSQETRDRISRAKCLNRYKKTIGFALPEGLN